MNKAMTARQLCGQQELRARTTRRLHRALTSVDGIYNDWGLKMQRAKFSVAKHWLT